MPQCRAEERQDSDSACLWGDTGEINHAESEDKDAVDGDGGVEGDSNVGC